MKNRILFVDDNPVLLQAYGLMLRPESDRWEVETASDATTALQLMGQAHFDVVASDMRLPAVSGLDLLVEVRKRHPGTARIMISGITDQEEVARTLGTTHQFLMKPVDPKILRATLSRIVGLGAYLQEKPLQAVVTELRAIPSFPSLYLELMKELQNEEPSIDKLAEVVKKDPGMTAKLLQVVNSAAFGLPEKTTNVVEAVQFLGWSSVRSIALSSQVFSFFERDRKLPHGFAEALWQHSLRTGALARRFMAREHADLSVAEDASIAGMLHDIGKLMLAHNLPAQFQQTLKLVEQEQISMYDAEIRVFGASHACAAAYLLGLWGLPAAIVEAVAFHHTPLRGSVDRLSPLAAVHVANVLERESSGAPSEPGSSKLDTEYLETIGLTDRVEAWRAQLQQ